MNNPKKILITRCNPSRKTIKTSGENIDLTGIPDDQEFETSGGKPGKEVKWK